MGHAFGAVILERQTLPLLAPVSSATETLMSLKMNKLCATADLLILKIRVL